MHKRVHAAGRLRMVGACCRRLARCNENGIVLCPGLSYASAAPHLTHPRAPPPVRSLCLGLPLVAWMALAQRDRVAAKHGLSRSVPSWAACMLLPCNLFQVAAALEEQHCRHPPPHPAQRVTASTGGAWAGAQPLLGGHSAFVMPCAHACCYISVQSHAWHALTPLSCACRTHTPSPAALSQRLTAPLNPGPLTSGLDSARFSREARAAAAAAAGAATNAPLAPAMSRASSSAGIAEPGQAGRRAHSRQGG